MNGAIVYSSKYGSTKEYAQWIGEATGLPVIHESDPDADPANYDFLVVGAPIIYYRLYNRKWLQANLSKLGKMPVILFTVSGAPPGPKLDAWLEGSLPPELASRVDHVGLRGRQNPKQLTLFDRLALKLAALRNPDPGASKEESEGFDYMDRTTIQPIIDLVEKYQSRD